MRVWIKIIQAAWRAGCCHGLNVYCCLNASIYKYTLQNGVAKNTVHTKSFWVKCSNHLFLKAAVSCLIAYFVERGHLIKLTKTSYGAFRKKRKPKLVFLQAFRICKPVSFNVYSVSPVIVGGRSSLQVSRYCRLYYISSEAQLCSWCPPPTHQLDAVTNGTMQAAAERGA